MAASIKRRIDRICRLVWAMTSLSLVSLILTGAGASLILAADQDLEKLNRFVQSSNSSSAAMNAFREGRDLINKEEWAKAADRFNQIVTRYPNSEVTDAALYWLAFCLKKQNKFQETDDIIGRLIKGFPRSNWIKDAKAMRAEIAPHLDRGERVTEEIHREYKLSPGARVEVSNINGPVEIETADTDTAEVHIVRSARAQKDLLDHKVIIEQTSAGLVVRGDPELDWLRRGLPDSDFLTRLSRDPSGFDWLRHGREVVTLKLPPQVDLSVKQINSRIKVGKIKGATQLIGVNGRAEIADLEGSAEASGINGGLNIAISRLGERGILVRGINGGAELNFANAVNAELDVGVVTGGVYVDVPDVTPLKINKDVISSAKIGAGGAPITISGVNGSVRIRRDNLGENTVSFKNLAHAFVQDAKPVTAPNEQMRKLEEIHREYKLSPGARVDVSNINGPVEIETADTDTAEVHITRFAQGRADVNDRKLMIIDTPGSLTIHAEGNSLRMGGNEVRHRVTLKIPRRVDLTIRQVSDRLKVGEIDGSIHLNGLSWTAEMALAAGQLEISRVSGTAVIRVTKLDEEGINISNVSGKVELLAPADLNANVDVYRNHGKVIIGLPHKVQEGTLNGLRFRAQIGSGGAPILISNIIGTVNLRQLTPSSPTAQKPETDLQSPNSAQVQNPTVLLPAGFGAFQKVQLSPEANSWAVQIISRGGFAGTGRGDLMITSRGHLVWNAAKNQCNTKLGDDVLQMLAQTAFSANASEWGGQTSRICADCFVTAIVLQRREDAGVERTYIAYWDDATAGKISEGLRKLYDTFMTHEGCKQ